ncbi:MAG TPA: tryptophan--tRNA ligase [Anaerolineales bacterium]|nr:tryptophan--tRNA ligase [Anaerolineales bacterium]
MADKIALTGIKPSGTPHVGNYLGMIRPALELARQYQALYFIADYHALTTVKDGADLRRLTYDVAATWLALGLDPEKVIFFRQSDIPEVMEFTWILSCFSAKGLLNRAHAYKASVDENLAGGNPPDEGINAGLYFYPVLMAADILLYGSHYVPVGADQKQHIEISRDIAEAFNNNYGKILTIPEAVIREDVMVIPGLDGRKMSKSYDNVIPIFAPASQMRKSVMRIVTDSRRPEESKDPESDNVFAIYRHFATPELVENTRQRYLLGGLAYSNIKTELFELLEEQFREARQKYEALIKDENYLDQVLSAGAEKARRIAAPMMDRIRKAVGTG